MLLPQFFSGMLWVVLAVLGAGGAYGQDYPTKPIRIIASGAGGGGDFTARLIAQGITGSLGQQLIIDNRPNAVVQGESLAKAPPDGYTLSVAGGNVWITPLLQKTPYDPLRDLAPITWAERSPYLLVVHPSLPVKSVKELIALAKARPGELNFSSTGLGASSHLSGELLRSMAGINIVHIPYSGTGRAIIALVSGEVQLQFSSAAAVAPHVNSGKLRALAVTSAEPSALAPGMPTVSATGLPGYESIGITAVFAPAKTPAAIISRLNQEMVRFLKTPEAKEKFLTVGVEPVGSTPAELTVALEADIGRNAKVIKERGLRLD